MVKRKALLMMEDCPITKVATGSVTKGLRVGRGRQGADKSIEQFRPVYPDKHEQPMRLL